MRRTALTLALAAALGISVGAQTNFSGTWVLDPARSEGVPAGMNLSMTVTQKGNRIDVQTNVSGERGQQTIPDFYVLDGKEVDYTPPLLGGTKGKGKRTSQWTADKKGFEAKESATLENGGTMSATRKWTLGADGKTLTVEMTTTGASGDTKSKRVFTKK